MIHSIVEIEPCGVPGGLFNPPIWVRSQEVRQGSAKASSWVQFSTEPSNLLNKGAICTFFILWYNVFRVREELLNFI